MHSESEQKAIQEKLEQLNQVKEESLYHQELADSITQRRVRWIKENLKEMLAKYKGLSPEEQAYKIVFFEHMGINPEHSKMTRVSPKKIKIESYNFCPYLEVCRQLDLDTKIICRDIGEQSVQKMIELINPALRFSRNYKNIRPDKEFCEEFIELL
jgi:actin-related protein